MRGIYKITNTVNGKCYIGKSQNIAKRIKHHIETLKNGNNRNKHMQNAYSYYGKGSFTIEILEQLEKNDDINEREKYWISHFRSNEEEYGYNRTSGGDGGNSYVDCMTPEERDAHYKKHVEIRSGENNVIYGKHLYNDGYQQKYLTDEQAISYLQNGWKRGAKDSFKETCRQRSIGQKNPFYGKKHSKESIEKAKQTKEERKLSYKGTKIYHKDGKIIHLKPDEIQDYMEDGWKPGYGNEEMAKKIKESKIRNFQDPEWRAIHMKNLGNNYLYNGELFFSQTELMDYLHKHGYPTICGSVIQRLIHNRPTKYIDLIGKITVLEKEKKA